MDQLTDSPPRSPLPPDTDVAEIFRTAKQTLTDNGWRQGMTAGITAREVCVGEALAIAYKNLQGETSYDPQIIAELCRLFAEANSVPRWAPRLETSPIGSVVHWNDAAGRTRDEVFAALDKAAEYAAH